MYSGTLFGQKEDGVKRCFKIREAVKIDDDDNDQGMPNLTIEHEAIVYSTVEPRLSSHHWATKMWPY